MQGYWEVIDGMLARIDEERPATLAGLFDIIETKGDRTVAFWPGDCDDFAGSMNVAGWDFVWEEAAYHFAMRHPHTGDAFHYVEGDIFAGVGKPLPASEGESK